VVTLGNIASYLTVSRMENGCIDGKMNENERMEMGERQKGMQYLKTQIPLAFVLGSEGHFGQGQTSHEASNQINIPDNPTNNLLLTKGSEAPILVELVSNFLRYCVKDGPG